MVAFKHIDGIMWASDVLTGREPFPSYNKEETKTENTSDDFPQIFAEALKERARDKGAASS